MSRRHLRRSTATAWGIDYYRAAVHSYCIRTDEESSISNRQQVMCIFVRINVATQWPVFNPTRERVDRAAYINNYRSVSPWRDVCQDNHVLQSKYRGVHAPLSSHHAGMKSALCRLVQQRYPKRESLCCRRRGRHLDTELSVRTGLRDGFHRHPVTGERLA